MNDTPHAAYLLIGPLAGVVVGFLTSEGAAWLRRRRRRRSLAAALLVEIVDQAQWMAGYGNAWNRIAKDGGQVSGHGAFRSRPMPVVVYPNVASEIPEYLGSTLTATIVRFYGNVEYISRVIDSWYTQKADVTDSDAVRIAIKWRTACRSAREAIGGLRAYADIRPIGNEAIELYDKLMAILDRLSNGEYIDPEEESLLSPTRESEAAAQRESPQ